MLFAHGTLAWINALDSGDHTALDVLTQASATFRGMGFRAMEMFTLYLVEACLSAGRKNQAQAILDELDPILAAHHMTCYAGVAARLRGLVHLCRGQDSAALATLWHARDTLVRLGAQHDAHLCQHAAGHASRRCGDEAQAQEYLSGAMRYFAKSGTVALPMSHRQFDM